MPTMPACMPKAVVKPARTTSSRTQMRQAAVTARPPARAQLPDAVKRQQARRQLLAAWQRELQARALR
jgi:hypothetical protein